MKLVSLVFCIYLEFFLLDFASSCQPLNRTLFNDCVLAGYNVSGDFTPSTSQRELSSLIANMQNKFKNCSSLSALMTCSVQLPKCSARNSTLPCRDVCKTFIADCQQGSSENDGLIALFRGICELLPSTKCLSKPNNLNNSHFEPVKCESLVIRQCQNAGYNMTSVSIEYQKMVESSTIFEDIDANSTLRKIICMEIAPPCDTKNTQTLLVPCRSMCNQAFNESAQKFLEIFKAKEYCSTFPENANIDGKEYCSLQAWPGNGYWPSNLWTSLTTAAQQQNGSIDSTKPSLGANATTPGTPAPNVTTPAANGTTPTPNVTTPAVNGTTPAPNVTMPAANRTTPAPNVTTPAANGTTPAPNVTTPAANGTTPAANAATPGITSAPNVTTPAPNVTMPAPNATTPAANATTPGSTPAHNATTPAVNVTTPAPNVTTPGTTSAHNATTPAPNVTTPGTTPAPNVTTPAPNVTTPAANGTMPAPNVTTPAPTSNGTVPSPTTNGSATTPKTKGSTTTTPTTNGSTPTPTTNETIPSPTTNKTAPTPTTNGTAPAATSKVTTPVPTSKVTTTELNKSSTSSSSPTGTKGSPPVVSAHKGGKMSAGAIAGTVVGMLVLLIVIVVAAICFRKHRQTRSQFRHSLMVDMDEL